MFVHFQEIIGVITRERDETKSENILQPQNRAASKYSVTTKNIPKAWEKKIPNLIQGWLILSLLGRKKLVPPHPQDQKHESI